MPSDSYDSTHALKSHFRPSKLQNRLFDSPALVINYVDLIIFARRNTYNQHRKSANSNYNQQHNNNSSSKSQYFLSSDPNPPNPNVVSEMIGQYVPSEHGTTRGKIISAGLCFFYINR